MNNRSTGKMISKWLLSAALVVGTIPAFAQQQSAKGDDEGILSQQAAGRDKAAIDNALNGWWTASMKTHDARIAWWQQARLGCFIHWGVYSVPGGTWKGKEVGGYAEHLMRKATIPVATYKQELLASFNPSDFNADTWVRTIKEAGMRYLIITAKHHDGVAMYPSGVSDMDISNSAFKRDPMKELAAACKRYGIKFGFYYSHAFDWEHPDAPGNDWDYDNPGGDKGLYGGGNWYDKHPERLPKAVKYVNEKAIPQIRELIHKYHPDILWFDTPHKLPLSENIRILQAIREIDNKVVVNGRLARSANISFGDYKNTADRPAEFYPVTGDWEAIPTTNESYGYSRYDSSHKPVSFFIQLIAKAAARGGNLLMNIGPMGNGVIDPRDTTILHGIGAWMKINGESIYSTSATPLPIQPWGESTRKGNRLFLQVFDWPQQGALYVGGLKSEVKKAWLLADKHKRPLKVNRVNDKDVTIILPAQAPDSCNSVVVLDMQNISTDTVRVLDTKTLTNVLRAFDADLQGKGLQYGDGKSNKYYVYGWNKPEQQLSWTVRVNAPARFRVGIKYAADAQTGQNNYHIKAGKNQLTGVTAHLTVKGERILTSPLGEIQLPAGIHQIIIQPDQIRGTELMKLFELTLTPVE